jgi:hypothetical protein
MAKTVDACPGLTYPAGEKCRGRIGIWNRQIAKVPESAGAGFGCYFVRVKTSATGQDIYDTASFDLLFDVCLPDPAPILGRCVVPSAGGGDGTYCIDDLSQEVCLSYGGTWTAGETCDQLNPMVVQAANAQVS